MVLARKIRILLVEDNPDDAQLVMAEVQRGPFDCQFIRVAKRQQVVAELANAPDLILSDFSLPDMTGLDLLGLVREHALDIPVIIISSTIGEEMVVQTMHAGAHDFISKTSLIRLNPAIDRELQEQEIHRQRRLAEMALVESEQNFRQLTESIEEVFWLIDYRQEQMIYLSPAFEVVWEQHPAPYMSDPKRLLETVHPDDYDRVSEQLLEHGWDEFTLEYRIVLPDGTMRWVNTRSFPIYDEQGKLFRIAGLTTNTSERMQLAQERDMMCRALEQSADAVMITNAEGIVVYVNPAFEALTGYTNSDVIGQTPRLLKSGFQEDAVYDSLWMNISQGIPFSDIFLNRRKDGELYYEAKTITPVRDPDGVITHYVSTGKDITNRLKIQERLNKIINYDAVTGLANRILLEDRLSQASVFCRRLNRRFGLLYVEFGLNELLGSDYDSKVREQILRQLAQRVGELAEAGDTVAHLGEGDFAILHRTAGDVYQQMKTIADRLVVAFSTPVVARGYELFITPFIGISLFPDDAEEAEKLLKRAKVAMEQAKKSGTGGYYFFKGEGSRVLPVVDS